MRRRRQLGSHDAFRERIRLDPKEIIDEKKLGIARYFGDSVRPGAVQRNHRPVDGLALVRGDRLSRAIHQAVGHPVEPDGTVRTVLLHGGPRQRQGGAPAGRRSTFLLTRQPD